MRNERRFPILLAVPALCLALLPSAPASADGGEYREMSLQELLDLDISVATKTKMTSRETPGIVTVITANEIEESGARDLIDVLTMVPGFQFGVDVQGVVGVGIRGLWGHEGKILLLVDGHEMNELAFSTLQFGNHFPVGRIARVEIIRGPGSAVYGGNAELAVINVVLRGSERNGGEVSVTDGEMKDANARRTFDAGWGGEYDGLRLAGSVFAGSGNRSDQPYSDFYGDTYSMDDQSKLGPEMVAASFGIGGFDLKVLRDRYSITQRDLFGENLPEATSIDFESDFVDANWAIAAGEHLTITPRFSWKYQRPWVERDGYNDYDTTTERETVSLSAAWDLPGIGNLLGGVQYDRDRARVAKDLSDATWFSTGRTVSYDNRAAFLQGTFESSIANVTLGARWEKHSEFGSSFVPRLGVTKAVGSWHFKLLASRAFRAPGIENIRLATSKIEPEKTRAFELEAGWQITPDSIVTANVFDLRIDKTIVYFVGEDGEGYANLGRTGSRGIELEARTKKSWGSLAFGWSLYKKQDNEVAAYEIPGDDRRYLGFARDKINLSGTVHLTENGRLSAQVNYLGKRGAITGSDADGNAVYEDLDAATLVNLYLSFGKLFGTGFEIGAGVFDLLDEKFAYVEPYDTGHPPLPGPSREYLLRLTWRSN